MLACHGRKRRLAMAYGDGPQHRYTPIVRLESVGDVLQHWNAGAALMAAQSAEAWRDHESASQLLTPNKAALAEQRCTLVVPVP
jgi:hypothetical protein